MIGSIAALLGFIGVSFLASTSGAIFRPGRWYYEELKKPSWNPPSWLFAPVWSLLFLLMSVAAWLVWREGGFGGLAGVGLSLFLLQLGLNSLWSYLFFGRENPRAAFFEVLLLWAAIAATMTVFWMVRPLAGALLVPYLLWVSFASYLNFTIWRLNPQNAHTKHKEGIPSRR